MEIAILERRLASENKRVRLIAIKLMLRHPDASPLQIVRCLCSDDIRNFESLGLFELHAAMQFGWKRLRQVDDDEVYRFLDQLYSSDRTRHFNRVASILYMIGTPRAWNKIFEVQASAPFNVNFNFVIQRMPKTDE